MDQGSCGLGKTPRYRHNSWLCWSGLPQNSRRFVGGIVSCLSACVSKLGRAWFFISCSACTGKAWPRCRGSGDSWGICRNAIKPASTRSAPGSVGGLWQVITASGQACPSAFNVKLRFGDATSGNAIQLPPSHPLHHPERPRCQGQAVPADGCILAGRVHCAPGGAAVALRQAVREFRNPKRVTCSASAV